MVVLATSLSTKSGKVLVSRQFVDIQRSRIEGLLAAFPKLLGNDQQHTFIETATVRYLYQRLDDLFLVVITNKSSNIVEDLETLRVLTKVVPDYCGPSVTEKSVVENGFELIFAFDEVVSMGYRESVTLDQIRTFTELDSHEERIYEMIEKNKEREAIEEAKRRMKEIEKERKEREKMGLSSYQGIGSGASGGRMGGMGSGTSYSSGDAFIQKSPAPSVKPEPVQETRKTARRGMQLGKKQPAQQMMEQLRQEGERAMPEVEKDLAVSPPNIIRDAVEVAILEQMSIAFESDGGLQQMQIMGEFTVTITDEKATNVQITVNNKSSFQFRVHPNIDKNRFMKEQVIVPNRQYPLDTPTQVLKWRHQTNDEKEAPLCVSCWPSVGEGKILVTVEYLLGSLIDFELSYVTVKIPIVSKSSPVVNTEEGSYQFDTKTNQLIWNIPIISRDNSRGSLEMEIEQWDTSGDFSWLFPVLVNFETRNTICQIKVEEVTDQDGNPVPFSEKTELSVHRYSVG